MNLAILGDIHGCFSNLKRIIPELRKCDAVFIVGDITGTLSYYLIIKSILKSKKISREKYAELVYGEEIGRFTKYQLKSAKKFVQILKKIGKPIFLIHGNSEVKEVREYFNRISRKEKNIFYLESKVMSYKKWVIAGYGYCSAARYREPFQTPGEKTDLNIKQDLLKLEEEVNENYKTNKQEKIGIFHEPPLESSLDYIDKKDIHGGSQLIKEHLERTQYNLVFVGHIHESRAFERQKQTLLINPGPLVNNQWAILDGEKVVYKRILIPFSIKGLIYNSREIYK